MSHTQYVTATSDKSKKTAFWLALLGLIGISGLHYFYVGKYFKGFIYFVTLGFALIGTIHDLIKISSGNFRDNVGVPLRAK